MATPIDLTGLRFGRLMALGPAHGFGRRHWLCRCDCGRTLTVSTSNLRSGNSAACRPCGHRTHGMTNAPEYQCYADMLQRCDNPKNTRYADYGGRGITVCARWREGFGNFLSDVDVRPTPRHSLDRIDNDGHYEPGNVRWAERVTQQANTRRARLIAYNGESKPIAAWARDLGLPYMTLCWRLRRWPIEQALTHRVRNPVR